MVLLLEAATLDDAGWDWMIVFVDAGIGCMALVLRSV